MNFKQMDAGEDIIHFACLDCENKRILIQREKEIAKRKALESLAKYKFQMFGYWAAIWVHLNKISREKEPNPFGKFVKLARIEIKQTNHLIEDFDRAK